jgi:phosphatidylserine decarboxylase
VKKSLDPTFPPLESTFDFPINSQHEIGGIELIAWDKDLLRKEYLGESCVAVADWFGQDGGEALLWKDDLPVSQLPAPVLSWVFEITSAHARLPRLIQPIVAALTSSRQKEQVTGSISLRIGYLLPASSTLDTASSDVEFIQAFHSQLVSRAINEQNLHSVPATSGIGTIDDASEAGSEVELDDDGFSDDDDEFDSHSEDEAEAQHLSASPLNLGTDPVSSALSGFPFQPFKRAFSFVSASKQPLPSPSVPTTNTEQSSSTYLDHLVATGGKAPAAAPPTTPGPMSGGSKSSTKKLQPGGKNAFTYNTNQKDILGIVLVGPLFLFFSCLALRSFIEQS